jgi:hypothetical protein
LYLGACAIVFSRRTDALLNPQFYVEDGPVFYQHAHETGPLRALLLPFKGYLVTVPRLVAAVAVAVPFRLAPLVMNAAAIGVEALAVLLVCSDRFARLLPPLWSRLLLAFLIVAAPNDWGARSNITHVQWHLAVLMCLVLVAPEPRSAAWRAFDVAVLVAGGLTGPFAILLAPAAVLALWARRTRWAAAQLACVAATAATQAATLVLSRPPPTPGVALGASPGSFLYIVGLRVVAGAFLGLLGSAWVVIHMPEFAEWIMIALGAAGLAGAALVAARGALEPRLVVLFAALSLLAVLLFPVSANPNEVWWPILSAPGNGPRYFMTPIFAVFFVCVWTLARARAWPLRAAAGALLAAAFAVGVRMDWTEPPLQDYDFPSSARRYEEARPGEPVRVPIPPNWEMVIVKR